jgi:hypothetical protein
MFAFNAEFKQKARQFEMPTFEALFNEYLEHCTLSFRALENIDGYPLRPDAGGRWAHPFFVQQFALRGLDAHFEEMQYDSEPALFVTSCDYTQETTRAWMVRSREYAKNWLLDTVQQQLHEVTSSAELGNLMVKFPQSSWVGDDDGENAESENAALISYRIWLFKPAIAWIENTTRFSVSVDEKRLIFQDKRNFIESTGEHCGPVLFSTLAMISRASTAGLGDVDWSLLPKEASERVLQFLKPRVRAIKVSNAGMAGVNGVYTWDGNPLSTKTGSKTFLRLPDHDSAAPFVLECRWCTFRHSGYGGNGGGEADYHERKWFFSLEGRDLYRDVLLIGDRQGPEEGGPRPVPVAQCEYPVRDEQFGGWQSLVGDASDPKLVWHDVL